MKANENKFQGKIAHHSEGSGTVTDTMIEERARELALINGRAPSQLTEEDLYQAKQELLGGTTSSEVVEEGQAEDETEQWENPATAGSRREPVGAPEEQTFTEDMTQQGMEEAEHDRMVQSAKDQTRNSHR